MLLNRLLNADTTNQKISIINATNSIRNKQLWDDSHYIRVSLISRLFKENILNSNENMTKDLKSSRLNRNSQHLSVLIDAMRSYLKPFSPEINQKKIFNIATGKRATLETKEFLLNARKIGEDAKRQFIDECVDDPERFETRTLGTEGKKFKTKQKDGKIVKFRLEIEHL